MDKMEKPSSRVALQGRGPWSVQKGRITFAGAIFLATMAVTGWGLYLSWDWLVATGLATAVLILIACGAMCTASKWPRWFFGAHSESGSSAGSDNSGTRQ